jgi:hypothetical protein
MSKQILKKSNFIFGLLFTFLFLIIGLYPLKTEGVVRIWFIILSLVFLIISIIKPNVFMLFNKTWIKFGIFLGKLISPIVMGIIFFLVVTPVGIFTRLLKKDVMNLKKNDISYWIDRKDKVQNMKKQF